MGYDNVLQSGRLGYCLEYDDKESLTMEVEYLPGYWKVLDNPFHLYNIVKILGDKPLEEIKAYIDKFIKVIS